MNQRSWRALIQTLSGPRTLGQSDWRIANGFRSGPLPSEANGRFRSSADLGSPGVVHRYFGRIRSTRGGLRVGFSRFGVRLPPVFGFDWPDRRIESPIDCLFLSVMFQRISLDHRFYTSSGHLGVSQRIVVRAFPTCRSCLFLATRTPY